MGNVYLHKTEGIVGVSFVEQHSWQTAAFQGAAHQGGYVLLWRRKYSLPLNIGPGVVILLVQVHLAGVVLLVDVVLARNHMVIGQAFSKQQ